jgi:hypothetical protein
MFRITFWLLVLSALAPRTFALGSDGWSQLKRGMMPGETAAALGAPLIRSASRGFELWIYDGHAEVVFFAGPVIAWTAPRGSVAADVHQSDPSVQPRSEQVAPSQKNAAPRRNSNSDGYEPLPVYRFRRRQ